MERLLFQWGSTYEKFYIKFPQNKMTGEWHLLIPMSLWFLLKCLHQGRKLSGHEGLGVSISMFSVFCDFLNIWSCSDSVGDFVFHFYLIHLSTFKKYMYYDYYYWFPFVISQNPAQTRCTRDNIMWSSLSAAGRWFSPGFPVSSTNRIDRHYITEILLKVVLNTIIITV